MIAKNIHHKLLGYFAIAKYRTIIIKIEQMKKQQQAQAIKTAGAKLSDKQLNWLVSAFLSTVIAVLVFAIRS